MASPPLIDIETLFADPAFSAASISPDGTRLAYLAPAHGRTNIWVRGIDEDHTDAVCVTHDARRGIKNYQWTDDPRWLLYLQDTDGNEDWHLYRVDLEAPHEPAVDLTPMDPGARVLAVEPQRSPPGTVLATMNRRTDAFDAFRIDIETGETTLHRESPTPGATLHLGPAGEVFMVAQTPEDGTWEFGVLDEAGTAQVIHREDGPDHPVMVHPVRVTPDGRGLLLGIYDGSDDLRLIRVDATGERTVVAAVPGHSLCMMGAVAATFPPAMFTDRRTGGVLAARFVGDRPIIKVIDPGFHDVYAALARLSGGVLSGLSSDLEGRRWVATFTHDTEPGSTYLYDHRTGTSRLLFRPFPDLAPAELAPMRPISITARDGLRLHGYLTLPTGIESRGLPLVLKVHGGPWCHDSWTFDPQVQFLANRGYAVLQVNFRGSSGYGRHHLTAAIGELAGAMHDDLIDAADWAVDQGYADRDRIGIYGGSYGGYATLVGVTFTPDYFAAAADNCGISDLANFMLSWPPYLRHHLTNSWHHYVGDPDDPDQAEQMYARSPISRIDRIRTPLLVVQGVNDVRVPKAESDVIVEGLRGRGVPVEYVVADDEGHGFQNHENVVRMWRAIERHFARHLGGRLADR